MTRLYVAIACTWLAASLFAQPRVITNAEQVKGLQGAVFKSSGQVVPSVIPSKPATPAKPGAKPGSKAATPAKSGAGAQKPDTSKKKGGEAKIIKRGDIKVKPGDPKELEVTPVDGKIKLSFRGQKWPELLDWYARVSGATIDWQELPNDYVNVSTQREVTLDEVRDLLNIHLLDRGYAMIKHGELLRVVATKSLNISKVPLVRLSELKLDKWMPHDFVRVTIPLTLMRAEVAATSLKELLSPNGKMIPLPGSNRLVAMDAVAHLRELNDVLQEEQTNSTAKSMREFPLRFTRADEIKEKVLELMGESSSRSTSRSTSSSARQMQMMMQQQQAMMQQLARARGGSKAPTASAGAGRRTVPLKIVANGQRNSLLVQAPMEKMMMIERAIEVLDVPSLRATSLEGYLDRVQVYRLSTLDPSKLATALKEMGTLDPSAKIQVDESGRALIVDAPLVDHLAVKAIIQKLDGSARKFEVIPLVRLDPLAVAGSIDVMIGNANKAKKDRNRYDYWDPWSSNSRDKKDEEDRFRVEADVSNKRILLWANEQELSSVKTLLLKLGEDPDRRPANQMVRTLEIIGDESTDDFLKRIKKQWEAMSPNTLVLPDPLPKKKDKNAKKTEAKDGDKAGKKSLEVKSKPGGDGNSGDSKKAKTDKPAKSAVGASTAEPLLQAVAFRSRNEDEDAAVSNTGEEAAVAGQETEKGSASRHSPPIHVTRGPDGRIVISSPDTQALDALQQLMMKTAPRQPKYRIFKLEYAPSFWIKMRIEDYFKDEEDEDDVPWWAMDYPRERKDDTARLNKKKMMKIISDYDTNTILVQGASPPQLGTIQELIKLYDVPERVSAPSARSVKLFLIKHSKAEIIANTIKDAFRDLLSSNDKALNTNRKPGGGNGGEGGGGEQQRSSFSLTTSSYLSGFGINEELKAIDPKKPPTEVDFKGQLSMGIDTTTNTLLVSTEGQELMTIIEKMIEALDQSAKPLDNIEVVQLTGGVNPASVHKALMEILNKQKGQQNQNANPNQQRQPNGQPNNNNKANPSQAPQARTLNAIQFSPGGGEAVFK